MIAHGRAWCAPLAVAVLVGCSSSARAQEASTQTTSRPIPGPEATAGVTETFSRDPKIGGMQLMVQYSHVRRTPFPVPAGTPADAAVHMLYFNVRYLLP